MLHSSKHPGPQRGGTWFQHCSGGQGRDQQRKEEKRRDCTVAIALYSPDIELLTVEMRPYYLPREFTSAILIHVYVPPSADAALACDVTHSAVAFTIITGDFWDRVSLDKTLPTFHQYVDCPTREHWIFCMQMLRMHTVPQPSPPLEDLTTTWSC